MSSTSNYQLSFLLKQIDSQSHLYCHSVKSSLLNPVMSPTSGPVGGSPSPSPDPSPFSSAGWGGGSSCSCSCTFPRPNLQTLKRGHKQLPQLISTIIFLYIVYHKYLMGEIFAKHSYLCIAGIIFAKMVKSRCFLCVIINTPLRENISI